MQKTAAHHLVNGCQVTEKLLERYGPEQVWQVQQLSDHIFRALLKDGRVLMAIVSESGAIKIQEADAVW